eukprot:1574054-Prymnesium_polylepis.1
MVHELRTSMPAFKSTRICWTRYCVHNSCSEIPRLPTFRHPGSRGEATWHPMCIDVDLDDFPELPQIQCSLNDRDQGDAHAAVTAWSRRSPAVDFASALALS